MSARLTPEQAEAVDSTTKEFEDASVEAASNHNADGLGLINCRILDLLDENAALRSRAEQAERGDVAWLVERESRPRWWTGRINGTGYREWTDESLEAIRFARREDAEAMIRHLSIEYGSKATHHAWTDAPPRATPAEGGAA